MQHLTVQLLSFKNWSYAKGGEGTSKNDVSTIDNSEEVPLKVPFYRDHKLDHTLGLTFPRFLYLSHSRPTLRCPVSSLM